MFIFSSFPNSEKISCSAFSNFLSLAVSVRFTSAVQETIAPSLMVSGISSVIDCSKTMDLSVVLFENDARATVLTEAGTMISSSLVLAKAFCVIFVTASGMR